MATPVYSDVIIVGAGPVGAALCHALALRGLTVAVVDAKRAASGTVGVRTSALTQVSCQWLGTQGLWPLSGLEAAPLRALQVLDRSGHGRVRFDSRDLGLEDLGVIVDHGGLETLLRARARAAPGVKWHDDSAQRVTVRERAAEVILSGGSTLHGSLLIAADGAQSQLREQLGVPVWQHHYGQTAICANIQLGKAHQGVAWQRFLSTGPLALLPLPDPSQSSLVWSTTTPAAERLRSLSDPEFGAALTEAFGSELGALQPLSARAHFPLVASHAEHYVGSRFALVGDAAHRAHPLAGQGVNLGFADSQVLAETLLGRDRDSDVGNRRLLRRYERARKAANLSMLLATDALNRLLCNEARWLGQILTIGLNVTDTLGPLKTFFMNQAGARPPSSLS